MQWLHAAQAPVRPRHCTQALLQQPDQLILSNTLPRPASSLEQRPSAPWLGPAKSTQAASFCRGSSARWGRNVSVRESGKMSSDTTRTDTTLELPFIGGVVLAVPCRVPQNMFKRRYWSEPKRHRKRHGKRHGKRHRERHRAAKEQPRERTSIYPGPSADPQGWVPLPLHTVRCRPGQSR